MFIVFFFLTEYQSIWAGLAGGNSVWSSASLLPGKWKTPVSVCVCAYEFFRELLILLLCTSELKTAVFSLTEGQHLAWPPLHIAGSIISATGLQLLAHGPLLARRPPLSGRELFARTNIPPLLKAGCLNGNWNLASRNNNSEPCNSTSRHKPV